MCGDQSILRGKKNHCIAFVGGHSRKKISGHANKPANKKSIRHGIKVNDNPSDEIMLKATITVMHNETVSCRFHNSPPTRERYRVTMYGSSGMPMALALKDVDRIIHNRPHEHKRQRSRGERTK